MLFYVVELYTALRQVIAYALVIHRAVDDPRVPWSAANDKKAVPGLCERLQDLCRGFLFIYYCGFQNSWQTP